MFVYEKFKEAESILLSDPRVTIPNYYAMQVDSTVDLLAGHTNCPMHDDSTASFRYYEDSDTCDCFGCGHGGNVIVLHRYVKKHELGEPDDSGITTYSRALLDLAKLFYVKIPSFYSEDIKDEVLIKPCKIKTFDMTDIPYKAAETQFDKKLQLLKSKNMIQYINICNMLDALESVCASKEEKKLLYTDLLAKLKL